jgi:hypothetical protein
VTSSVTPTVSLTPASNPSLALPLALVPLREGSEPPSIVRNQQRPTRPGASLVPRVGTPAQIVEACRASAASAALPYGAVRVDAASAGRLNPTPDGGVAAPVEIRIVYARTRASQTRQSRVSCRLNAAGTVVALR